MHLSKIVAFAIPLGVVLAANCSPGTQTINNRQCTTACNVDRPGSDYTNKKTGSLSGCITACANDPKCLAASYHEDNQYAIAILPSMLLQHTAYI